MEVRLNPLLHKFIDLEKEKEEVIFNFA